MVINANGDLQPYEFNSGVVAIQDNQAPTITCPPDMTINGMGFSSIPVNNIAPNANDNCGIDSVNYVLTGATTGSGLNDASGQSFNEGVTTVTYTVTDLTGQTDDCSFTVEVQNIPDPNALRIVGDSIIADCQNDTVKVNFTVQNFNGVTGISFGLLWDPSMLTYIGNQNAQTGSLISPDIPAGEVRYLFTNPGGLTLANGTTLFTLCFTTGGSIGNSSSIAFTSLPANGMNPPLPITILTTMGQLAPASYSLINGYVEIQDLAPPDIVACPTDISLSTDLGQCDAVVNWTAPFAIDDCDPNVDLTSSHISGSTFNPGTTQVTYIATDDSGKMDTCTFNVVITDTEAPTLICPSDTIVMLDTLVSSIAVNGILPVVSDNCILDSVTFSLIGATMGIGANDASGTVFNEGVTTVTYIAVDVAGNSISCSFDVTVVVPDFSISCPMNLDVDNDTGQCGAEVNNIAPVIVPAGTPLTSLTYVLSGVTIGTGNDDASGTFFNVGTTTITYTAIAQAGDTSICSFTVTVNDTEAPVVMNCLPDTVVNTLDSVCYVLFNFAAPTFTDNCMIDTIISSHNIGDTLMPGTITVSYEAIDIFNNSTICSYFMFVSDMINPVLICPQDTIVVIDTSQTNVVVNGLDAIATDNCVLEAITFTLMGATDSISPTTGINSVSGILYNLGTTVVTYTAVDEEGNFINCNFNVNVVTDEGPQIVCPSNVSVPNDTLQCGAVIENIEVTIISDINEVASITYEITGATMVSDTLDASGTFFNLGISMVTYYVVDMDGDTSICSFMVEVLDTEFPVIVSCPDDLTISANDDCEGIGNWDDPVFTDNCPGLIIVSTHEPGDTFPLGITNVFYTALDSSGRSVSCGFTVTVIDNTNPIIINCPPDTSLIADSLLMAAIVSWTEPTAVDSCGMVTLTSNFMPGATFPIGVTSVEYVAIDESGNTDTCRFTITVFDGPDPTIFCPADMVIGTDAGLCSATVDFTATAANMSALDTIICTPEPNSTFPIGTTTVECILFDDQGDNDTCSFTVTVVDNELPVFDTCPRDTVLNAVADQCGRPYEWGVPVASDNCGIDTVFNNIIPGEFFPVGTTTVYYIAVDFSGNKDTCSFDVTVFDDIDPVIINCPSDTMIVVNDVNCGTIVNWVPPTCTDNCPNSVLTSNFQPGDFFALGQHVVVYTCTDESGNTSQCTFQISIFDGQIPLIENCPSDITVTTQNGDCSSVVDWVEPTITDNCPGLNVVNNLPPGTTFPVGTTEVFYIAIDAGGLRDTCSFNVTVLEDVPPNIICPANVDLVVDGSVLSDPNSIITSVVVLDCDSVLIEFNEPVGFDNCPGAVTIQTDNNGFTSGSVFPVGNYTFEYTVTDASGNSSSCQFTITVNGLPPLNLQASENPICEGSTLQLFVEDIPGGTYFWIAPDGDTLFVQNPIINSVTEAVDQGVYTAIVVLSGGCRLEGQINIDVLVESPPTQISTNSPLCEGEDLQLELNLLIPGATYEWSGPNGYTSDDDDPVLFNVSTLATGQYCVTIAFVGCGSPVILCTDITVIQIPAVPIANDDSIETLFETPITNVDLIGNDTVTSDSFKVTIISDPSNGTVVNNGDGTISYTPDNGFAGPDFIVYELCILNECVDSTALCDLATVTIVTLPDENDCSVFNTITPNNDGVNDEVYIQCLDAANPPANELIILNRWGDEIYRASPYQNDWKGTYNGDPVPDGTYYYIFFVPSRNISEKGFITVFR